MQVGSRQSWLTVQTGATVSDDMPCNMAWLLPPLSGGLFKWLEAAANLQDSRLTVLLPARKPDGALQPSEMTAVALPGM